MKIDKAIEILDTHVKSFPTGIRNDLVDAIILGKEALKAVKECRASHMFCPGLIMPGETQ